jgi:hypothetical protein
MNFGSQRIRIYQRIGISHCIRMGQRIKMAQINNILYYTVLYYFFGACLGCYLLLTLFLVRRFLSP